MMLAVVSFRDRNSSSIPLLFNSQYHMKVLFFVPNLLSVCLAMDTLGVNDVSCSSAMGENNRSRQIVGFIFNI